MFAAHSAKRAPISSEGRSFLAVRVIETDSRPPS